jgi:Uma2 family endonuclease
MTFQTLPPSLLGTALPSTADLPCSDDTPVDNEDQNLLPNLLLLLLTYLWSERMDWYFGADMAIYHTTGVSPKVPVVPDGFLSLGVERRKGGKSRRSYATWEEGDVVPIFVLEMVSHQPGGEYDEKLEIYAKLGVLYYLIYNPEFWQRDRHQPFELYKLVAGEYQLQLGEPYWMPEIGLGIGRYRGQIGKIAQEMLTWYDTQGARYLTAEERAEREQERAERLEAYLRSQGIDPSQLPG